MARDIFSEAPPLADYTIAYGSDPNQFGELRLPKGGEAGAMLPTVVYIHGGFWRARYDLKHAGHAAAALTDAGFATWNVEYRRLGNPSGGWPGTFLDVAAAVDFLRELAPRYNLDLGKVVVAGHSAGGQLAAWIAARHKIPAGDPLYSDAPLSIKGVVPLAGVVDLRLGWKMGLSNGVVKELLGGTPQAVPQRYAVTSPAELLPLGVPQILIHGTDDAVVPYEISRRYVESALQKGDNARLVTLPGVGHFEMIDPESKEWPQVVAAVRALLE